MLLDQTLRLLMVDSTSSEAELLDSHGHHLLSLGVKQML